ncbi:MAG TPA: 50S ribosomal protein L10 [Planctomycetota bacterium]|jgi:large subunit ribosomal protein L10|nr:50S ribosomal protein L10 [Planctomycetota bacterium]
MPNLVKRMMAEELRREVGAPSSFLFVGIEGLAVQEATNLRASLGEWNLRLRVVKNSLASRAFRERGIEAEPFLRGPTAVIGCGEEGAIAAARILLEARKRFPKLELRGGLLEGRRIGTGDLPSLASIPAREVLLAQVLAAVLGPASTLATLLEATLAIPSRLAAALAVRREKESADAPPA